MSKKNYQEYYMKRIKKIVDEKDSNDNNNQYVKGTGRSNSLSPLYLISDRTIPYIHLVNLKAYIENKPTKIETKSPNVLKYRTPHFVFVIYFNFNC